jgi:hypothetical protein
MTDAFVRPATLADARALAENIRPHDAEECRAFGREPLESLLLPFFARQQVYAISDPTDTVYAVFGVTDMITWGCPWMLASNQFHKIARPFASRCRQYFDLMSAEYSYLENRVSANNRVAHRWLNHLGFTIEKQSPEVHGGVTFYPFWKYNRV